MFTRKLFSFCTCALLGLYCSFALAADEKEATGLDTAELIGKMDKRAIDYKIGEEMTLTLSLQNAKEFAKGTWFVNWKRTGDDGKTEKGRIELEKLPFIYKTTLDRPGFFRMTASVTDTKGNPYKKQYLGDTTTPEGRKAMNAFERRDRRIFFDGGAGADVQNIASVPEPADFDAFWQRHRDRLKKVPLQAEVKEIKSSDARVKFFYVSIACAGARPSTGCLTIPVADGKYPISVSFHGYGHTYPNKGHVVSHIVGDGNTIWFNFSPHGYEMGRESEYYDEFFRSICSGGRTFGFDPKSNEDAETCYFSGFTYRIIRALEYLKTRPEWDGKNLRVTGGSMGGMQSLWAAGLDSSVTLCEPSIPWNCDIGGRDTLKRIIDPWYIHESNALRYFDPVNLAKRIPATCTVNITRAGLGDYCCPPSGIFAMWNVLKCPKRICWVQGSTHGYVPSIQREDIIVTENYK